MRSLRIEDHPFLKACRREPADYTPVWLMRQAGRYLKEYRSLRKRYSFLEMCKNPRLSAEVTLLPLKKFKLDAAIIFSDILVPLEPMGVKLEFTKREGPVLPSPIREMKQIEKLRIFKPEEGLSFLLEAIQIVRKEIEGKVPLIGFSGAPFTLASYLIEGGHSNHYTLTKGMMFQNQAVWQKLMEKISEVLVLTLNAQIQAGVQAIQLFDSWVGCLSPEDYDRYVLPFSKKVIRGVSKGVPLIHFATNSTALLELMRRAGGDVIGIDWRVDLKKAWKQLGYDIGIQGNLDPVVLLGPRSLIQEKVKKILNRAESRPGHIFNLGHGVLPNTPVP